MYGAPLWIFRPTSLWLSLLFPLAFARALSSNYPSLYLASKFLPLLSFPSSLSLSLRHRHQHRAVINTRLSLRSHITDTETEAESTTAGARWKRRDAKEVDAGRANERRRCLLRGAPSASAMSVLVFPISWEPLSSFFSSSIPCPFSRLYISTFR